MTRSAAESLNCRRPPDEDHTRSLDGVIEIDGTRVTLDELRAATEGA